MIKKWVITNKKEISFNDLELLEKNNNFQFYSKNSSISSFPYNNENVFILVDGFILPRVDYFDEYSKFKMEELVFKLYKEHNIEFIKYIKGNFVLILIIGEKFYIFTDRIGVKKFFYFNKNNEFIFTNQLKLITDNIDTELCAENIAINSLMNHYIDGQTFLRDISYSKPASEVEFNKDVKFNSYWDCEKLLNLKVKDISFEQFAFEFRTIVKAYIDYLKPKEVSLTLTGGLDNRVTLATLLNIGIKPSAFTYGDPLSADIVFAKKVAKSCNLKYKSYYKEPTPDWFSELADEIIDKGNSIINIHRAHRLDAIKKKVIDFPNTEMVFGGYMGGETIRCFYYDNLIISEFVKRWWNEKGDKNSLIEEILDKNFIKKSNLDLDNILEILKNQRYFGKDIKRNQFFITYLLSAGLHHSQDPNLFNYYIKYPVPIYIDIDFLNLAFNSKYNFLHKSDHSISDRIKSHGLYCNLISILAPQLLDIPFAKRGFYSTREYLDNSFLILTIKRMIRYYFKKKYPVNFSLDKWMYEYVKNKLFIREFEVIYNIHNIDLIREKFNSNTHKKNEAYWQKYTTPITLSLLCNYYKVR